MGQENSAYTQANSNPSAHVSLTPVCWSLNSIFSGTWVANWGLNPWGFTVKLDQVVWVADMLRSPWSYAGAPGGDLKTEPEQAVKAAGHNSWALKWISISDTSEACLSTAFADTNGTGFWSMLVESQQHLSKTVCLHSPRNQCSLPPGAFARAYL